MLRQSKPGRTRVRIDVEPQVLFGYYGCHTKFRLLVLRADGKRHAAASVIANGQHGQGRGADALSNACLRFESHIYDSQVKYVSPKDHSRVAMLPIVNLQAAFGGFLTILYFLPTESCLGQHMRSAVLFIVEKKVARGLGVHIALCLHARVVVSVLLGLLWQFRASQEPHFILSPAATADQTSPSHCCTCRVASS
jgi:hypothetical protein